MYKVYLIYRSKMRLPEDLLWFSTVFIDNQPLKKRIDDEYKLSYGVEPGYHILVINLINTPYTAKNKDYKWIDADFEVQDNDVYIEIFKPLLFQKRGKIKIITKEKYNKILKTNRFYHSKIFYIFIFIIGTIIAILSIIIDAIF